MRKTSWGMLLNRIIEFANEPSSAKLPLMLDRLVRLSEKASLSLYQHPFFLGSHGELKKGSWLKAEDKPVEKSCSVRVELRETLSRMVSGGRNVVIDNNGFVFDFIRIGDKEPAKIQLRFKRIREDDPGNLSAIMSLIMLIDGIKDVKKCPACEDFFVIRKNMRKKTCSAKCKQRMYETNLSPEKKKKARHRRSDWYYAKKQRGDK